MAFDVIIRFFAADSNLSAALAKANAGLADLGSTGPGARKGLNMVQGGIQALARDALGATGPVGRLATGLLQFGGGAALATGVGVGAGVVALAWREMSKDAERAASNAEAAAERIRKAMKAALGGGDTAQFGERLDVFRDRLEQARAEIDRLMNAPLGPQRFGATPGGVVLLGTPEEDRADAIRGQITTLNHLQALLAQGEQQAAAAADKATAALERQGNVLAATIGIREQANATGRAEADVVAQIAEVTARATAEEKGWDAARTASFVTQSVRLARLKDENAALEAQRDLIAEIAQISANVSGFFAQPFQQDIIAGLAIPSLDEILGRSKFGVGIDETIAQAFAEDTKRADFDFASPMGKQPSSGKAVIEGARTEGVNNLQAAQLALSGVMSLAGSGGSAGGILGGLGGLAGGAAGLQGIAGTALAGPLGWAGLGLSALSTGFGLLSNNADKNADKVVKAIERQAKAITEQRATIVVIGPDGHATRTALQRLEDSDAVERIPGPVGVSG